MKKLILTVKWFLIWSLFIMPFQGMYAQLVAWQFGTPASDGNEVVYLSTSTATGMAGSLLTRGSGIGIPASLSRGFGGTGFVNGGTKSQAETSNAYYQFTVAAQAGYEMSLSTLDAVLRRSSSSSPGTYCWKYSTDGTNFTQIGSDIGMTNTDAEGIAQTQISLSGIGELQNVPVGTVVTFRLYAWGASSTSATFGIGKTPASTTTPSLAIGGTVTQNGPPSVVAWHFNGKSGDEESVDATTAQAGLYTATLTRGNGAGATPLATYARSFYTTNFTIGGDKANALSHNEYLQTTISVANGYKISLSSIDIKMRRSSGGPNAYRWYYSTDGSNYAEIDDSDFSYTSLADGADGLVHPTIQLSGIAGLQNVGGGTTITLRLYLWGATTSTGSFAIGRYASGNTTPSLIIGGSIEQEPTLVAWQFSSPASTGNEAAYNATTNNPDLITSVLTRATGMDAPSTYARGFYIGGYTGTGSEPGTKQNAIDNNHYIAFSVAANGSKYISFSSINARFRTSATGPKTYRWKYSLDGTNFIEIGDDDIAFVGDAAGNGVVQPTVDLSDIAALHSVAPGTTVTFRLYAWGATSNSGTFLVGLYPAAYTTNSLMIGGIVSETPLPITLSKFSAVRKGTAVLLNWVTSSEINVDKFEIEKSQDGQHFVHLTDIKAVNVFKGENYSYVDDDVFSTVSYYRLKIWDKDGSFRYSEIAHVKGLLRAQLSVYPNPVDKWLTIGHAPVIGTGRLTITDVNGNRLIVKPIVADVSQSMVDVGHLAKGVYFITLQNSNEVTTGKFIKR